MSAYYPAVMAQVDFACSVLGFIKRLLRAVVHTTHNLESVRRRKKLDAQRDGRRNAALSEGGEKASPVRSRKG